MEEIVAMGFMDLVKKAFLGASDEDNRKNRARVRDTFNSCVQMAIQFVPVMYKQTISRAAKCSVSITQSSAEVSEFRSFFKKGL